MDINVDEYAAINLLLDYLLLLATARIGGYEAKLRKILPAAAVGAAGAVGILLYIDGLWPSLLAKALLWVITGMIGLGCARIGRKLLLYLLTSFLFGGGLWALSLLFGEGVYTVGGVAYARLTLPKLILFALGLYYGLVFCAGRLFDLTGRGGKLCRIRVIRDSRSVVFSACRDTGCHLRDPVSNAPVLLAEKDVIDPLFPRETRGALKAYTGDGIAFLEALPREEQRRFRLVPCKTVAGDTLLPAFRPDGMTVDGKKIPGLVALCPHSLQDCGARAILGEV